MRRSTCWLLTVLMWGGFFVASDVLAQTRDREKSESVEEQEETRTRSLLSDPPVGARQRDRDAVRDPQVIGPRFAPPRPGVQRRWFLGVEVEYRDIGAQVTRVVRRSPAERVGLEVRDLIVTVNGYQVGRVAGRQYPLEYELEVRADRRGNVVLLVQNHRNNQLLPVPVQLEPAERQRDPTEKELILGTISARRTSSLGSGAVLQVRLLDVTERRLLPRVIAQRTYRELGPWPLPYELEYSRQDIQAGRKYALDATVTVNGFAALRTTKRYPVLESDRQGRVNMVVEPVRR